MVDMVPGVPEELQLGGRLMCSACENLNVVFFFFFFFSKLPSEVAIGAGLLR